MHRDTKRTFNQTEKNELYRLADGKCQKCGNPLLDDWEADHIKPWQDGGLTTISNGQALCQSCNRQKGKNLVSYKQEHNDNVKLRDFQKEMERKGLDKYHSGEKVLVCIPYCGSGKTLGALHLLNALYREGVINGCIILTPRVNLCRQYELDWRDDWSPLYDDPKMGKITHRLNRLPILKKDAFGYITTYASLVSDLSNHLRELRKRNFAIVLDEAQQLGVTPKGTDDIQSTLAVERLIERARFIILMTATEKRSDGRRLFLANYSDEDAKGCIHLEADVETTYRDGVAKGYLRPFDFKLIEGIYKYQYFDTGKIESFGTPEMKSGLHKILKEPGFWQPLIDQTIEQVREAQTLNKMYSGLIAAYDQGHAKAIERYLNRRHKNIKHLIAISDDGFIARDNLERFKDGEHDLLITVRMAYIGYDHAPITVVTPLTGYRFPGYLDQLFGRGLRIWSEMSPDEQVLWGIVPDDPRMKEFVEKIRSDSEDGTRERKRRKGGQGKDIPPCLGITIEANVVGVSGQGIDDLGDLSQDEFPVLDNAMKESSLVGSRTGLNALIRRAGGDIKKLIDSTLPYKRKERRSHKTELDHERTLRSSLANEIKTNLYYLYRIHGGKDNYLKLYGQRHARQHVNKKFGVESVNECDMDKLLDMLHYVINTWRKELKRQVKDE